MKKTTLVVFALAALKTALVAAAVGALAGCSDPSDSNVASCARKHGFTDVRVEGWAPFVCGEDDTFATTFTATNARGERVEGVACTSLVTKGCTIRF